MPTVQKMTSAALTTFNSLDRAVDFETPDSKTFRILYNTKTQGFGNTNVIVSASGIYAQIDSKTEKNAGNGGQCVSFVKALCAISVGTASWIKGSALTPTLSIVKGTAIATFTKNNGANYDGTNTGGKAHTGIFIAFYSNLSTGEKGIEIFDQNWIEGGKPDMIGRIRRIPFNSSATDPRMDAGRYYIITI